MFEQVVKGRSHLERYRTGAFAKERELYLTHLYEEGRSHQRLQIINSLLLTVASRIDLTADRKFTLQELAILAEDWSRETDKPTRKPHWRHVLKMDFVFVASGWLRFLGRLADPPPGPFARHLDEFLKYLKEERGFAEVTLDTLRRSLTMFFDWVSKHNGSLAAIKPPDFTQYFSSRGHSWKRTTISFQVQSLRSFFRYAGLREWCHQNIAKTIDAPRLYTYENLQQGPSWSDVQRLIKSTNGNSSVQIRNRAVILLLSVYGFRIGEVCKLRLGDIDWEAERIHLQRPKQRKLQEYPLAKEVGEAIIRYLKEVRPHSQHREIFLSLRQPYRPLSVTGLGTMVSVRLRKLGLQLPHYGPHVLRHACATHLLSEGFSLKEIGDHLGHVSVAATRIYSKVNLPALREVADFDLCEVVTYAEHCDRVSTPIFPRGSLVALREVARLRLGGLL
jgi:site-specific recombinase XerD